MSTTQLPAEGALEVTAISAALPVGIKSIGNSLLAGTVSIYDKTDLFTSGSLELSTYTSGPQNTPQSSSYIDKCTIRTTNSLPLQLMQTGSGSLLIGDDTYDGSLDFTTNIVGNSFIIKNTNISNNATGLFIQTSYDTTYNTDTKAINVKSYHTSGGGGGSDIFTVYQDGRVNIINDITTDGAAAGWIGYTGSTAMYRGESLTSDSGVSSIRYKIIGKTVVVSFKVTGMIQPGNNPIIMLDIPLGQVNATYSKIETTPPSIFSSVIWLGDYISGVQAIASLTGINSTTSRIEFYMSGYTTACGQFTAELI